LFITVKTKLTIFKSNHLLHVLPLSTAEALVYFSISKLRRRLGHGRVEEHLQDQLIDASAEILRWRRDYDGWGALGGSDNKD
jgi:hypothetical protein